MKIKFYGTGAAEGVPAVFCKCEVCEKSRKAGGKNIRSRSQAAIDGTLLIDLPPDTFLHAAYGGLPLQDIKRCLITHAHGDHFYPAELEFRMKPFAHGVTDRFALYGSDKVKEAFELLLEAHKYPWWTEERVKFTEIKPFISFEAAGYKITPLAADHGAESGPVIYLIGKADKTLLYAHDTGYFPDETWDYLRNNKIRLNLATFDCTGCTQKWRGNHMGLDAVIEVRQRLLDIGCCDDKTRYCLNHFSHNGGSTYDGFEEISRPHGFTVAYDGLEIEV
ncbi:hypothetical protein FACS1894211_01980 [Clostridia bacterium]|nr:hypothetical protein FACS1894211_01980 [Clostridia bacterium]